MASGKTKNLAKMKVKNGKEESKHAADQTSQTKADRIGSDQTRPDEIRLNGTLDGTGREE